MCVEVKVHIDEFSSSAVIVTRSISQGSFGVENEPREQAVIHLQADVILNSLQFQRNMVSLYSKHKYFVCFSPIQMTNCSEQPLITH